MAFKSHICFSLELSLTQRNGMRKERAHDMWEEAADYIIQGMHPV